MPNLTPSEQREMDDLQAVLRAETKDYRAKVGPIRKRIHGIQRAARMRKQRAQQSKTASDSVGS